MVPMESVRWDIAEVDYTETHLNTLMKVTRAISTIAMTLIKVKLRVQRVKEHANLNAPATIVEEESIEPPADTTVDVSAVVTAEDTGSH
jgi:hypothetical protein